MKKFPIYVLSIAAVIVIFFFYSLCILKFSIKVNETTIESQMIPTSFDGVRLIQFSDVLIENEEDLKLLEKAVYEMNELKPDIVIFTGDLFKEGAATNALQTQTVEILSTLETKLANIAILGNEDLTQPDIVSETLMASSFKVLRNESIEMYNGSSDGINFIGIDSLASSPQVDNLLSQLSLSNKFNILLIHEPALAAKTTDHPIEVQLSGHCRGLSSISNNAATECNQFYAGTYRFADQLILHVNRGLNRPNEIRTLLSRPTIHSFLLLRK